MRKITISLIALLLLSGSAYALNETADNGQQNITRCYAIGTAAMTSGNVVVLTDDADTTRTIEFYGKEVTGTVTAGQKIYGVVVTTQNYTPANMATGEWLRVQTYGYNAAVKVNTSGVAIAAGNGLGTSSTLFNARVSGSTGPVTSGAVALEAQGAEQTNETCAAWLDW